MKIIQKRENYILFCKAHVVITLLFCCMMLSSCDSITRSSHKEYEELSTKTYLFLDEAINDAQSYIDYFSTKKVCNHCEDVKNIRNEFHAMKSFLDKNSTYSKFLSESEQVPFSNSSYQSVRNTWRYMFEQKKGQYLNDLMNGITPSSFSKYFKEYANSICNERWGGIGGLLISDWEENELGSVTPLDNFYGKKCNGIYTIHMKGPLGLKKGSARIQVEGSIVITTTGSYNFNRIDYRILRTTGDLQQ